MILPGMILVAVLTLLLSEQPKLQRVLGVLSAKGFNFCCTCCHLLILQAEFNLYKQSFELVNCSVQSYAHFLHVVALICFILFI